MKLVIVESPHKSITIGRYLGDGYKVVASQGHIRDLSMHGKGGLGIDVEHEFKPDWALSPHKSKIVNDLKNEAKKADEVLLATDPDREGEAISWHLAEILHLDLATTKRLQFHEITKPAIMEAIENPKYIDMNLVDSQMTRRMYDRIIGFKLSSLLQKKMGSKSAGRVQSVTLKMIVDNDAERKAFVPEEYWTIEVEVLVDGKPITLSLSKVDGKTVKIHNEAEAKEIIDRIPEVLELSALDTSKKKVEPKFPFTTSTMQQEAYNRFKFSTNKTQSIAQRLYEGLEIAGENVGLITYMRTDSSRISPEFFNRHAKPFIEETFGKEYVGYVKAAKKGALTQDAHEAIRPTGTHRTPELVAKYVTPDEAKLYRLIYDRAMASLMSPKVVEENKASFTGNGLTFTASGSHTLFKGYEVIYGAFEEQPKELPPLKEGAAYSVSEKKKEQKFTQPPAAYSEAKVVKLMEEKGIGRPSTYATTIQTLQKSGYVTSKGGVLTPTEQGIRTTAVLSKYFPEIVSTEYTANMENRLDEIEKGEEKWLEAMNAFYGPFMNKFQEVEKVMWKDQPEETGELCPECGSPLVVRRSKFGTFIGCSNYPKCRYMKKNPEDEPKETGELCPKCGKPLVIKKNRRGKTFIGCSGYPNCDYIKPDENAAPRKPKKEYSEADYVKPCPSCKEGHLVVKEGKRAKFLGCTNYPKCRYHEWIEGEKGTKKSK
ncbi:MAG: type I DNA topoisomerase [Bacilli bacterium]|nr:type I DNA topoisomerase [Bacilli bacterium]